MPTNLGMLVAYRPALGGGVAITVTGRTKRNVPVKQLASDPARQEIDCVTRPVDEPTTLVGCARIPPPLICESSAAGWAGAILLCTA
jgi:hypothetical protein